MNKTRLPSMIDVARKSGVSIATVSLSLRSDPRISQETQSRVRKAAQALGYVPDPVLSALVARRDFNRPRRTFANLAALVDDRWSATRATAWHQAFINGIETSCKRLGYTLDVFRIHRDLVSAKNADRILHGRGIRGLILLPLVDYEITLPFDWNRYAAVALGNPPPSLPLHRIGSDGYIAINLACERLQELGYQRVGLAHSLALEKRLRCEWLAALSKEHYLRKDALSVVEHHLPSDFNRADFLAWARKEKPECVISGDTNVIRWLTEGGFSVPGDIGVVLLARAFSDAPNAAGISQHLDISGETAVEQLHTLLLRGETGIPSVTKELLISPHWVDGDTLRQLRPRRAPRASKS